MILSFHSRVGVRAHCKQSLSYGLGHLQHWLWVWMRYQQALTLTHHKVCVGHRRKWPFWVKLWIQ